MKKLLAVLSAVLLTACCTACSASSTGTPGASEDAGNARSSENDAKIAVVCKSTDPYWDSVKKATQDAQAELGMKIPYTAPEKENYQDQITLMNQAVANGAKVIVLAPVVQDEPEFLNAISEIIDKGVQVITIDSDISLDARAAFLATNNEYAASLGGEHAKTLLDDDPVIAVLTHDTASPTSVQRSDGFINVFETDSVQILDPVNCEGDIEKSKETVIQMITDHPEIDIVYATNQPTTVGVCQGVESLISDGTIEDGQVKVVGFDYFDGADAYLDNGILSGVVIQHPYNMGYFGVTAANYLLNGQEIPVSMMDTGSALVTKDNLHDDDIQFMINPAG